MFSLAGKKILVTGASGGIGAAIAATCHGAGGEVILSGTRQEALERLATQLGSRTHVIAADLSNPEAAASLIDKCEAAAGQVDILVNNAGLTRDGLMVRMKDEDWNLVLEVNLTAGFRLSRAALRGMMKRRMGRIIGISSVVGVTGNAGQTNYAAAKAGMIGFSKALAAEVAGRNITVNAIAPGFIQTPMTDDLSEAQKAALLAKIPSGRLGTVGDVAAAVLYLASGEAAYVTGQTLHVNGGLAMV